MFRIIKESKININQEAVLRVVWHSIWRYFGLKEANKIGLWLVELDLQNGLGIIRCSHHTKEFIISALTLITDMDGEKIIFSPIKTSGTIKALNKIKEVIINRKIDK